MKDKNTFRFNIPEAQFFEKSGVAPDKQRRIGGIATIQTQDRQNEILLQKGLDFSEFIRAGWFNDNHSSATTDILGYPESTQFFQKGEILPNGQGAIAPCHWVEGYLLDTQKATEIWDLARSLQKTPRRLGLSVEGKIQRRSGLNKAVVTKAIVREVAITKAPVNMDSQMELLAKSLTEEINEEESLNKCSYGPVTIEKPIGPKTGEVGRILAKQSLEKEEINEEEDNEEEKSKGKKQFKKGITDDEALIFLSKKVPNIDSIVALKKIISLSKRIKNQEF